MIKYYKRQDEDVVLRAKINWWDREGRTHFEDQGYTKIFPKEAEE